MLGVVFTFLIGVVVGVGGVIGFVYKMLETLDTASSKGLDRARRKHQSILPTAPRTIANKANVNENLNGLAVQLPEALEGSLRWAAQPGKKTGVACHAALKNNMLFLYSYSNDKRGPEAPKNPLGAVNLDGVKVEAVRLLDKRGRARTMWHPKNCVRLTSDKPLVPKIGEDKVVYVYLPTARELERWYVAFFVASGLRSAMQYAQEQERAGALEKPGIVKEVHGGDHEKDKADQARTIRVEAAPRAPIWFRHYMMPLMEIYGKLERDQTEAHEAVCVERALSGLVSRIFWDVYKEDKLKDFIKAKIDRKLSLLNVEGDKVRPIASVLRLDLSPRIPAIYNVRNLKLTDAGMLSVDMDFQYQGGFEIEVEVEVIIEILGRTKTIPVLAGVRVLRAEGSLHIEISPPPTDVLWVGFHSEPHIELDIHTEIKIKHHKFKNLKQIASAMITNMKKKILTTMVLPEMDDWPLPFADIPGVAKATPNNPNAITTGADVATNVPPTTKHVPSPDLSKASRAENEQLLHVQQNQQQPQAASTAASAAAPQATAVPVVAPNLSAPVPTAAGSVQVVSGPGSTVESIQKATDEALRHVQEAIAQQKREL